MIREPLLSSAALALLLAAPAAAEKTHFTYLWHLEQPIYWPDRQAGAQRYERAWQSILRRDAGDAHPENDLRAIFGLADRVAAYQFRPRDCVSAISWASESGAQVSYSGGLIANIQSFADAGGQLGYGTNWHGPWRESRNWQTNTPGNDFPRMDVVVFSFHHALLPLIDGDAIRKELALYKEIYPQAWGAVPAISKGFFPSEMAFSTRLIPYLAEAGIDWSFVSGEKLSRACAQFPVVYGSGGINCDPPNKADQLNPAQANYRRISISRGCGPAEAVPFAYTPHRAKHVDPNTGAESFVTVVPCSQHLGWMDGYNPISTGELGALEAYNDPNRPQLVVFAHDGDNAWGGGYSYYMEAVPNFVSTAESQGYKSTVVQKYLNDHPVPAADVVHVEDGAWVNADGDFGAPQFLNWNWPPVLANGTIDIANGWAEDIRNWAVITAAQNYVSTAEQIHTAQGLPARTAQILAPNASSRASERAWHFFLGSLNSGYMYYGTAVDMEVKPTIACNEAILEANSVIGAGTADATGPTVWIPQRFPWNPGSTNFGPQYGYQQFQSNGDFKVWTFVHDVSGTQTVTLKYRLDDDGENPLADNANELYAQTAGVGAWQSVSMTKRAFPAGNFFNSGSINFFEMPAAIADQYYADITGVRSKLVDYFVEAVDSRGNVRKSPIQHVWVGDGSGAGGGGGTGDVVTVTPTPLVAGASATVSYNPTGRPLAGAATVKLHYGYNGWAQVASPDATMTWSAKTQRWTATVPVSATATQFDVVFNNGAGVWDNNGGADWHFTVTGSQPPNTWTMDGAIDADAVLVSTNGARHLWAGIKGSELYVATEDAGEGDDVFVFVASNAPGALRAAPWAKSGQAAAWTMFMADENDNAYSGWFNDLGNTIAGTGNPRTATGANGGVVEGTIDLAAYLGAIPQQVAVAAAPYGSANAGVLKFANQAPASVNANTTLDAVEFVTLQTCAITIPAAGGAAGTCCPADLDANGSVGASDLSIMLNAWGTANAAADLNGDGTVAGADLALLLGSWGGC